MNDGLIYIANNLFETLFAISNEEQRIGLMHVDHPAPTMTFIYSCAQINKFWMSNTKIPLDIIFCHAGEVVQICKGEPYSTAMIGDDRLTDLVIELPYGTAKLSDIKLGHKVGLVKPTKDELNKIIAEKYIGIIKF